MMYYTHLAFAFFLSLISLFFVAIQNPIVFILITTFSALLPDIDQTKSKLGKRIKPISFILQVLFGHRTLFHSFLVPIFLFALFFTINVEIALAILIGYSSHLILDSLTPAGIRPLYPLPTRKMRGRIKTGSFVEKMLFTFTTIINLLLIISIEVLAT